jgi:hypothetical protein
VIKNKKLDIKLDLIIKDLQKEWNNGDKRI